MVKLLHENGEEKGQIAIIFRESLIRLARALPRKMRGRALAIHFPPPGRLQGHLAELLFTIA